MNSVQYFLGYLCVLLVFIIQKCEAIKCYDCNSAQQEHCLGSEQFPLVDSLKKQCPDQIDGRPYTLCRKIKQVIDFEVNGLKPDTRIIRTCGYEDSQYANRCYQRSGFGGRQEVCACQTDDCNHSSLATASLGLVVTLLMVLKCWAF